LEYAKQYAPDVQVTVTKPGAIDGLNREGAKDSVVKGLFKMSGHVPRVHVSELAAAMIDQCLNGIIQDPLWSDDLAKIGKSVLSKEDYLR
jgi:hypothetical protein